MKTNDAMAKSMFNDNLLAVLYQQQKKKPSNIIVSPLSILIAMTLCMAGSDKGTLKEMITTLYPMDTDKVTAEQRTKDILKLCQHYNNEYGAGNKSKKKKP